MIEMDFVTRYTIVLDDSQRGGASFAARMNHLIERALEGDGVTFKDTPGNAIPKACTTDVYRIEYFEEELDSK